MKHQPQRTCIACRQVKDKRELVRVVRISTGEIVFDGTGKANGRGAYICRKGDCWQKGLQQGRLARALKTTISTDEIAVLQAQLVSES